MTDTTPTMQPAKAMWTRCNACQDRIYNNPHDIKIHRGHCPFDLQMTIQKLTQAVFGTTDLPKNKQPLTERIGELEQQVGDLDEHVTAEPALDPDAIDPDAYTDVVGVADATLEDDQRSQYADEDIDFLPNAAATPTSTGLPGATHYFDSGLTTP